MAINDLMIVDGGGWLLIAAGVLAIVSALIRQREMQIISAVSAAAAASFIAGSMRATYIQLGIFGNEYAKSEAGRLTVASWGWLLVVSGVVLVTAAAILAKVHHNEMVTFTQQPQAGD